MDKLPPCFTWIEDTYNFQCEVPIRLRCFMQLLWLHGTKVEDLSLYFKVPEEWVEDFIHDSYPSEKPN